jgi:hypothetical protein
MDHSADLLDSAADEAAGQHGKANQSEQAW